ncbi:hypothetical protein P43SY_011621 [Pythium insidiosum]|uniref:Sulfatase N-terminal domain-containing protein n=1 Tax=Pythium insidiosum TaxID=114742 RepID=A0AAD5Q2T0_PYTIN|nr:hypothetical protein P43SY_011621 [Pythium insidiosum]
MESFRSLDVGVIGARAKKAATNQTVTPFFDKLSETGVLFRQHYTPCVQTSRTLVTSLFGTMPSLTEWSALATSDESKLRMHGLPQILKEKLQYESVFWSAVNLRWENWSLFLAAHGFDKLLDENKVLDYLPESRRSALTEDDSFSWGRHDKISLEALEHFLEQRQGGSNGDRQPLFLDVYTISSHDPWVLPQSFSPSTNYSTFITEDNEKYLHALNYVDQSIEQLVTNLRRKGLLRNTVLLLEGDHGYGRMEHDDPTVVASYVYDEGSHIPMLLVADDLLPAHQKGMVVDDLTSQTDLQATITDMLGLRDFMQHGMGQSMMRRSGSNAVVEQASSGAWNASANSSVDAVTNASSRANAHTSTRPTMAPRSVLLENPFYGTTKGLRVGHLKYALYGSGSAAWTK